MSQWIAVTDAMPEEGVEVLTWSPVGQCQTVAAWWPTVHSEWRSGDPRADLYNQFDPEGITHWMPLPAPPAP